MTGAKSFPEEFEDAYLAQRLPQIIRVELIGSIGAALSFVVLIWWDAAVDSSSLSETVPIRLGVAAVLVGFGLASLAPLSRSFHFVFQAMAYATITGGFGWLLAILPNGFDVGYAGLAIPPMFFPVMALNRAQLLLNSFIVLGSANLAILLAGEPGFTFLNVNVWLGLAVVFAAGLWVVLDLANRDRFLVREALEVEKERSDSLLRNILPEEIAERLKRSGESVSTRYDQATILFADIVGFTAFSRHREPDIVVDLLNALFSEFDDLVEERSLEKIKTIGDGYMVAGGVPVPRSDHAASVCDLGLAMLESVAAFAEGNDLDWEIRVGIHSGSVVAGVIGKHKFAYDLWGDTVNVASRLESSGSPGRIQLSMITAELLPAGYDFEQRGPVTLHNVGTMETCFLQPRKLIAS
jgi:class 3 adenylate cyclase